MAPVGNVHGSKYIIANPAGWYYVVSSQVMASSETCKTTKALSFDKKPPTTKIFKN